MDKSLFIVLLILLLWIAAGLTGLKMFKRYLDYQFKPVVYRPKLNLYFFSAMGGPFTIFIILWTVWEAESRDDSETFDSDDSDSPPVSFKYTNYKGEVSIRSAIPGSIRFGTTKWHPTEGYLFLMYDVEKQAEREFALADCDFTTVV